MSRPENLSGQEVRPVYEHVPLEEVEDENGNTAYYMCSSPWANAFSGEHTINYGPFTINVGMTGLSKERDKNGSGDFGSAYVMPLPEGEYYGSKLEHPFVILCEGFDHVTPTPTIKADWQKIMARNRVGAMHQTSLMRLRNPNQIFSPHLDITGSFLQQAFHSEKTAIMNASEICAARFGRIAKNSGDTLNATELKQHASDFIIDYAGHLLHRFYETTQAISGIFDSKPIEMHIAKELGIELFEHDLLSYAMNGPFNITTLWGGVYDGKPFCVSANLNSEADVISNAGRLETFKTPYLQDRNSFIDYLIKQHKELVEPDEAMRDRKFTELLLLKMLFRVYGHSTHFRPGENSLYRNARIDASVGDFKKQVQMSQGKVISPIVLSTDGARNLDRNLLRSVVNTSSNEHLMNVLEEEGMDGLHRLLEPMKRDDRTVIYANIMFDSATVK